MAHQTSSDPNVFILPDLGEGVHEAELIAWKVKPGDAVEEHQTLAEMETDKALVEVPSPRAGVIKELHGAEGEILNVGEPLVTYEGGGKAAGASKAGGAGASSAKKSGASSKGRAEKSNAGGTGGSPVTEEREDAGTVVGAVSDEPLFKGDGKALATPAVRRLARDLGVDINTVRGTGLAGRVTEKDVRAAAGASGRAATRAGGTGVSPARTTGATRPEPATNGSAAAAPPARIPAPRAGETQRIPFRGTRRTIAQRLRQSIDTAVHFNVMDEADASALDALRRRTAAASGEKLSFLPFVMSAVCRALKEFPALNATVDDEAGEILRHPSVHLGIATDTEHGLNVPVVPDADALGVLELGRHVAELARMARDRSIPRERLVGSTFTISNVGSYAGRFATPVINSPEVAILAVGRVREGVVVRNGGMFVGKLMPLSLACDHRVVDGAEGARFLQRVID
ncbi:MAG: 2-oxo acid dehydrogenase subunit E2, partial [Planctomycetota bacterium]